MGRFYSGDINGKFWFGIQDSDDISNLVTIDYHTEYTWKICNCTANLDNDNYCTDCYSSITEHIDDAIMEEDYDDECLYYEDSTITYNLDKEQHYSELLHNMNELKTKINKNIIEEFEKIEQNDKILDTFTGIFDDSIKLLNKIKNEEEHKVQAILVARYTIGYQMEYCLKIQDECNINCEC